MNYLNCNYYSIQANDEIQYRHFLRDLEMRGRLSKFYLPESNYSLCKMKSKVYVHLLFLLYDL